MLLRLSIACGLWSSRFNHPLRLPLSSISLADLLENSDVLLIGFMINRLRLRAVIGGFWSTLSVSVFLWSVSRLQNYDWRQLNARSFSCGLKFGVRVIWLGKLVGNFLKFLYVWKPLKLSYIIDLQNEWSHRKTSNPSHTGLLFDFRVQRGGGGGRGEVRGPSL